MTSISLKAVFGAGYADYGRKSVSEMITAIRRHAEHEKATAEAILAAADEDFHVATYVGVHCMRDYTVIQEGSTRPTGPQLGVDPPPQPASRAGG